ncbi:MAG: hypothetical protein OEY16_01320 [Alphaproteobacteria bacterium]|nr:hypothetical protein [Alphaproteobacteria bacterium]
MSAGARGRTFSLQNPTFIEIDPHRITQKLPKLWVWVFVAHLQKPQPPQLPFALRPLFQVFVRPLGVAPVVVLIAPDRENVTAEYLEVSNLVSPRTPKFPNCPTPPRIKPPEPPDATGQQSIKLIPFRGRDALQWQLDLDQRLMREQGGADQSATRREFTNQGFHTSGFSIASALPVADD